MKIGIVGSFNYTFKQYFDNIIEKLNIACDDNIEFYIIDARKKGIYNLIMINAANNSIPVHVIGKLGNKNMHEHYKAYADLAKETDLVLIFDDDYEQTPMEVSHPYQIIVKQYAKPFIMYQGDKKLIWRNKNIIKGAEK